VNILYRNRTVFSRAFVRFFYASVFLCLFFSNASTQKLTAVADRNKILIGEQVSLIVKAEDINTRTSELPAWISFYDSSGHIQFIKQEAIDTIEFKGYTTYIQNLAITSFDSGRWVLPPLKLLLRDKESGKQTILATSDSIALEVLPVDVSGLKQYHDIKEIQEVEAKPNYVLYVAIALSIIGLTILVWLLLKKKKQLPKEISPAYKETALASALKQIKELEDEKLPQQGKVKLFYTRITDICRRYFNEQLQVRSAQLTSDEIMLRLSVYLQHQKRRSELYQLLRLADAAKFAKYKPSTEENASAIATAVESLKHIDNMVQLIKANVNYSKSSVGHKT
jgi:preprotein translocase subunit Sec61beta